jgi:serine/threonine-protein kinase
MRAARVVLLVMAVTLLAACGGGQHPILLASWTLDTGGETTPLTLPAHFDQRVGDQPKHFALRTRVDLPPEMQGRLLALTIPYFTGLATLRANGVEVPDLDATELDRFRSVGAHRYVIPAEATRSESLALELDVDHTWTQSAWVDTVPRLTADPRGDAGYVFVKLFDRWSTGAALAMILLVGFANLVVFLNDRRRTAYGWFALASFAGSMYAAYTMGFTQIVFRGLDPSWVGICVCVSSVATARFTAGVFGRKASPLWWGVLVVWSLAATRWYGPFHSTRYLSPITISSTVLAGVYSLWLLLDELRRGRPPAAKIIATIAWPVVCVAAVDDFASWLGMGELYSGVRSASVGIALLSIMQAAALGSQLLETLRHADGLNAELGARVDALERTNVEVRTLNEELRRQVSNRSLQLAETLAKVGSLHLPVLALEPGDLVQERYRVVRFVGSGGMAWVYEVKRETDGRRLALKVMHGRSSGAALARFAREAQLAAEVSHPCIVGVVDVDLTTEGVLFLVMEYVDGKSLEQYLDEDPPMAWAIAVLRQIAEGLEEVHARAIVHRDLKPANVLVEESTDGPHAKIADFGVSMLLAEAKRVSRPDAEESGDVRVTRAGRVMGTPTYMAPELALDGAAILSSIDMYAFGVMAHELLVGRPPFRDPLFVRAVHGRSLPPPTSLAVARPRLDRSVAELVDRCLSLDAALRPSAREAVRTLRDARLEVESVSVPSVRAV